MRKKIAEKWFSFSETKRFLIAGSGIVIFGVVLCWVISGVVDFFHDRGYSATQSELKRTEENHKSEGDKNLGAAEAIHKQTTELESEVLPTKKRREKAESDSKAARLKFEEKRKIYEKNRNRAADVANPGIHAGDIPTDAELRAVAAEAGINFDNYK